MLYFPSISVTVTALPSFTETFTPGNGPLLSFTVPLTTNSCECKKNEKERNINSNVILGLIISCTTIILYVYHYI